MPFRLNKKQITLAFNLLSFFALGFVLSCSSPSKKEAAVPVLEKTAVREEKPLVEWSCQNEKLEKLEFIPSSNAEGIKNARLQLYQAKPNKNTRLLVEISEKNPNQRVVLNSWNGKICPDAVFVKTTLQNGKNEWKLDTRSFSNAWSQVSRFEDVSLRRVIWAEAWNHVLDTSMSLQTFTKKALSDLPKEKDEYTLTQILKNLVLSLEFAANSGPNSLRSTLNTQIETLLWKELRHSPNGSRKQHLIWDTLVEVGKTPDTLQRFEDSLETSWAGNGFRLDRARRWKVIERINAVDPAVGEPLRIQEEAKDKTPAGHLASITAEASQPIHEVKEIWFQRITSQESPHRLEELLAAIHGFFSIDQEKLKKQYENRFYTHALHLIKVREPQFLNSYFNQLLPTVCESSSVLKLGRFIEENQELAPEILDRLKEKKEEREKCSRVRERAAKE